MRKLTICAALLLATTSFAHAKPKHHRHHHTTHHHHHHHHHVDANGNGADPRPSAWCAWWLRRHLHIPKSAFHPYEWNLAKAFRYIGSAASGPCIGCIVVWWHHVGLITGHNENGWVVLSGNVRNSVYEGPRSLKGAIAYRHPPSYYADAATSF